MPTTVFDRRHLAGHGPPGVDLASNLFAGRSASCLPRHPGPARSDFEPIPGLLASEARGFVGTSSCVTLVIRGFTPAPGQPLRMLRGEIRAGVQCLGYPIQRCRKAFGSLLIADGRALDHALPLGRFALSGRPGPSPLGFPTTLPLVTTSLTILALVGCPIALVSHPVTLVGGQVAFVGRPVTKAGQALALVGHTLGHRQQKSLAVTPMLAAQPVTLAL